jgi:hypothetical protein
MTLVRDPTEAERERHSIETSATLTSVGDHFLCELNLETRTYTRLTQLAAMYF